MDAVNVCLVGHRGVGKTTFLSRVTACATFDLDQEIERATGLSVERIFAERGEATFRALEQETLATLLARPGAKVIALGAGFDGPRPTARIVWLRRETDHRGRIFLDRPRLDPELSPLEEYRRRFSAREARFRRWADQILTVPEGYDGGLEDALGDAPWSVDAEVTLRPGYRPGVRARRFEVRDDLGADVIPAGARILRAYRPGGGEVPTAPTGDEDWALELGDAPRAFTIQSAHEGPLDLAIERLGRTGAGVLKLAVEVRSFDELARGHRWWSADRARRAFLPRSRDGRWRWYRSLFGPRMPLHFVREDEGSALDQPLTWQTRLQTPLTDDFAAVLGSPVDHSRTPLEHRQFFAARGRPVVAIDCAPDEWDVAWPVLNSLGLTHAAVTAPLKARALGVCDEVTADARSLGAVNTLVKERGRWRGGNTDVLALRALARELGDYARVWLWGGGGVKGAVRAAWPTAREISARTGVPEREPAPDLVVWAVGRDRRPPLPPAWVRPRLILDLNYAEDSPALEWALRDGLAYRSGLAMFTRQAREQRAFWSDGERKLNHAWQPVW